MSQFQFPSVFLIFSGIMPGRLSEIISNKKSYQRVLFPTSLSRHHMMQGVPVVQESVDLSQTGDLALALAPGFDHGSTAGNFLGRTKKHLRHQVSG
jgi:hypothetical protein